MRISPPTSRARGGIYLRLSEKSNDDMKIGDQESMCRKFAAERGIEVLSGHVYTDDGISGYDGSYRPGFERLLKAVERGELDVLVAQSVDRFTRDHGPGRELILACIAADVRWQTINDGEIDPADEDGEFLAGLYIGLARKESRRKSKRQRQRNEERRLRGDPAGGGPRPFGYGVLLGQKTVRRQIAGTNDYTEVVVPDYDLSREHPDEAPIVREMYAMCLAAEGTGLSSIATMLNHRKIRSPRGRPWDLPKVEKVLRRARNAGLVEHRLKSIRDDGKEKLDVWPTLVRDEHGKPVLGKWERIIDEGTYFAVMAKLEDPVRALKKPRAARRLMSSLARCECGVKMRGGGLNVNGDYMYRCGVHQGAGPKLPGVRHTHIRCVELDPIVVRAVVAAMMITPKSSMPDPALGQLQNFHVKLTKNRQAQQLVMENLSDPDLIAQRATFKAQLAALAKEESALKAQINDVAKANAQAALLHDVSMKVIENSGVIDLDHAADLQARLTERFNSLSLNERRALIREYVEVTVHRGRLPERRVQVTHKIALQLNDPETNEMLDYERRCASGLAPKPGDPGEAA